MSEAKARAFIVDDDEAVCDSIQVLLGTIGVSSTTFASAIEFLDQYDPSLPGCLILDVRMAGMGGLELQTRLAERGANLPIIFITGHGDVEMAVHAMQRGAVDFLQKPFNEQKLLDVVLKSIETDRNERERQAEKTSVLGSIRSLTEREREVMNRVVHGDANKVVALDLGVSERTIEIHRARVMKKMKASSLAHLVRMVLGAEE